MAQVMDNQLNPVRWLVKKQDQKILISIHFLSVFLVWKIERETQKPPPQQCKSLNLLFLVRERIEVRVKNLINSMRCQNLIRHSKMLFR